jgi:GAF domain-containing protein
MPVPFTSIKDPASLRRVLEAVSLINRDLPLPSMLRHAVDEARSMTSARYGAIGVFDREGRRLEQFVTAGLTPQEEEQIGSPPADVGVLGQLITDSRPLRMSNLEISPKTLRLPSAHPPVTSFLGVPITVRDEVYGSFYLTNKIGWAHFTSDDQALIEGFAFAVGIAVESTRLRAVAAEVARSIERDRRAKDLHDTTIQRLFGLGLKLESMAGRPVPQEISKELSAAVVHIDTIINQVRRTIFEMDPPTT